MVVLAGTLVKLFKLITSLVHAFATRLKSAFGDSIGVIILETESIQPKPVFAIKTIVYVAKLS